MYTRLKDDMTAAGYPVSEGPELTGADQQQIRDFFAMTGKTLDQYMTVTGHPVDPETFAPLTAEEMAAAESYVDSGEGDEEDEDTTNDVVKDAEGEEFDPEEEVQAPLESVEPSEIEEGAELAPEGVDTPEATDPAPEATPVVTEPAQDQAQGEAAPEAAAEQAPEDVKTPEEVAPEAAPVVDAPVADAVPEAAPTESAAAQEDQPKE